MSPAGWELEAPHWEAGRVAAGVDEAGRGPLAGPVVAAAVIFSTDCKLPELDDSKKLTPKRREELFLVIQQEARACAWAVVGAETIDAKGILPATFQAMGEALAALEVRPDYALIDGNLFPPQLEIPGEAVVKGDGKCASIAAASILAKVVRDRLMAEFHAQFPHYGFDQHKGYCTDFHLEMLERYGPCAIHRRSFAPVRDLRLPFG